MDDATEVWISSCAPDGDYFSLGWDYMLVRSAIEWQGPARSGEILSINTGAQSATPILRTGVAMMEAADMGSAGTPLTPGVQTISKTVVIVWEIE